MFAAVVATGGLFWLAAKRGIWSPNGGSVVRNSLALMFALAGIAVGVDRLLTRRFGKAA